MPAKDQVSNVADECRTNLTSSTERDEEGDQQPVSYPSGSPSGSVDSPYPMSSPPGSAAPTSPADSGWSVHAQGHGEPPEAATPTASIYQSSTMASDRSEGPSFSMNNGWANGATGETDEVSEWGPPGWTIPPSQSSEHPESNDNSHATPGTPQQSLSLDDSDDGEEDREYRPPRFLTPELNSGPVTGNGPLPTHRDSHSDAAAP